MAKAYKYVSVDGAEFIPVTKQKYLAMIKKRKKGDDWRERDPADHKV